MDVSRSHGLTAGSGSGDLTNGINGCWEIIYTQAHTSDGQSLSASWSHNQVRAEPALIADHGMGRAAPTYPGREEEKGLSVSLNIQSTWLRSYGSI